MGPVGTTDSKVIIIDKLRIMNIEILSTGRNFISSVIAMTLRSMTINNHMDDINGSIFGITCGIPLDYIDVVTPS